MYSMYKWKKKKYCNKCLKYIKFKQHTISCTWSLTLVKCVTKCGNNKDKIFKQECINLLKIPGLIDE